MAISRSKYARDYNKVMMRQELILAKQMRRALNLFVRKYASLYQRSAIAYAEDLLLQDHERRINDILTLRYKRIIPFSSKFAMDGFIDDITKADSDILIDQADELVEDYILENSATKSQFIASTSLKRVQSAINVGVTEGGSIIDIASYIRGVQKVNTARALTIARTEVHQAANYGGIETARNAQRELNIKMVKEWVAISDGRTRSSHQSVDGQEVDVDEKFNVGADMMDRPLDSSASAANVVNCRCTAIYKKKRYKVQ